MNPSMSVAIPMLLIGGLLPHDGAAQQSPAPTGAEPGGALLARVVLPAKGDAKLTVSTPAWKAGGDIPFENTQYRGNVFPGLQWSAGPAGTQSYVIIMQDPDAMRNGAPILHWTMYNIPSSVTKLDAGDDGAAVGCAVWAEHSRGEPALHGAADAAGSQAPVSSAGVCPRDDTRAVIECELRRSDRWDARPGVGERRSDWAWAGGAARLGALAEVVHPASNGRAGYDRPSRGRNRSPGRRSCRSSPVNNRAPTCRAAAPGRILAQPVRRASEERSRPRVRLLPSGRSYRHSGCR